MKSKTLMALAVAGTFACGGAFAGPFHHGAHHSGLQSSSVEVISPSSVDESAPWLASQPHSARWSDESARSATVIGMQEGLHSDGAVGASTSVSASGYGGFDSLSMSDRGYDASLYGLDYSLSDASGVEYWLWGDESYGTGASSGASGTGSGGFDSSFMSYQGLDSSSLGDDSFGTTDYYVISGPLSQFDLGTATLYEASPDEVAYLISPSEGVWLFTPIEDLADASGFSDDAGYQLSQYSPLSGDEDPST